MKNPKRIKTALLVSCDNKYSAEEVSNKLRKNKINFSYDLQTWETPLRMAFDKPDEASGFNYYGMVHFYVLKEDVNRARALFGKDPI